VAGLDPRLDPDEVMPFLHVGHRYYDPATGRFLQRDPIGITGGLNVYAHVFNRPTMGIDPSGQGFGDGDNAVHNWVANSFWRRIHSDETLANMSDARAVAEAVGISVGVGVAGAGAYVAGGALAAGGGTASISVGTSGAGASGLHFAVGSSTAGWWHFIGVSSGSYFATQLGSSPFGTRILTLPARYPDAIRNMSDNAMNCVTGALRGFFSAL
jgi:RHS repeat-associated protein